LFTSSAVIYGNQADTRRTLKEGDEGYVNQLSNRACFDEGKRFAEACVATYNQVHGLDAKIARVFTTYGPHMRLFEQQLIPDFILSALEGKDLVLYGDKDFSTSRCYVTDMVDALVRLMTTGPEVKVVNIGGDQVYKYTDVAEMIIKMTDSQSKLRFDKPNTFLTKKGAPDLTYAKEVLGWFPLARLEDGLRKTIDYVISHKEALQFDHTAR
jgi:UDP-glucuronate decarboxylase